ncbi:hypothetical protein GOP47_0006371 [Adiantum capillus-veneris]|uniref:PHD-type domain-containing protein n=1 Tax=Adiantum capillus-veneris TaxID=13818 RepID=A0A9D4ZMZ3_ADICA|nr:hypothetical protein GOP47_0006371 [Adiantum capillus-veneris]
MASKVALQSSWPSRLKGTRHKSGALPFNHRRPPLIHPSFGSPGDFQGSQALLKPKFFLPYCKGMQKILNNDKVPRMETGTINVSQNFVSAYQERMAMEVLTCVNNLQSRCDMLEDASAILGCAACCSGIESTSDGSLHNNCLQENYLYTDVLASAVGGRPFIGQLHSSQIDTNNQFFTSNILNQQMSSYVYAKRLRKRPAISLEEETAKKKGKANHLESLSDPVGTLLTGISGQPHAEREKLKAAKPRKGKDFSNVVKVEDGKPLLKAPEPQVRDEETDAETVAFEWQRCVSLLKGYGVIDNPDFVDTKSAHRCVPHPGYAGDGLLTKMCKICGTAEDANNTVICDDCQEAYHLSCCVPRLTSKYFKREDNWFCVSCRKQRRKMGPKFAEKGSSQEDNNIKAAAHNTSKARLGPAHQANVPEWQERALEDDLERRVEGCIGMEGQLTEEQRDALRDNLLRTYDAKIQSLGWLPAEKIPSGTKQNWVKCNNVISRAYKDGRKQSETVCGKWRRAPLNVEQTDEWECFCAIEWDPLHADCAVPQECSDEEVLSRIAYRTQAPTDILSSEAGGRKSTLRQGKLVL